MGQSEARAGEQACAFTGAAARNCGFILMDIYGIDDDDGCATCRTGGSWFRKYERRVLPRRQNKWRKVNHVLCMEWVWIKVPTYHITSPLQTPHPPTLPLPPNLSLKWSTNSLILFCKWHEWSPSSSCHPHPVSAAFITLLCVFRNPPSYPDAEVSAMLSASWRSRHQWQ